MNWTNKTAITKVEAEESGYAVNFGSHVFFLQNGQNPKGLVPRVGDQISVKIAGNFVAGVRLNDQDVFDMTDAEIAEESLRLAQEVDRQRRELFEKMQPELDQDYAALAPEFRSRIDRFRGNNPDFRWKYEAYEMAVTKAAASIAAKYGSEDAIVQFKKLKYEDQLKAVPELFDFSGHMVAFACLLAGCYVVAPHEVINVPGSLAPMIGMKEYG